MCRFKKFFSQILFGAALPLAAGQGNLLKNPDFEKFAASGKPENWICSEYFKCVTDVSYSGKASLLREVTSKKSGFNAQCDQILKLDPGKSYRFGGRCRGKVSGGRPQIGIYFQDAQGKYLRGFYPRSQNVNDSWYMFRGEITNVPEKAARAVFTLYAAPRGGTGKIWFDSLYLEEFVPSILKKMAIGTDQYRNTVEKGIVKVYIYGDFKTAGWKWKKISGFPLKIYESSGKIVRKVVPESCENNILKFSFDSSILSDGKYELVYELKNNSGTVEHISCDLVKRTSLPRKKVYFDKYKRMIVDDKPFFPIILIAASAYNNLTAEEKLTAENLNLIRNGGFNTLFSYEHVPSEKMMLDIEKAGLRYFFNLKDDYHDKWFPRRIRHRTDAAAEKSCIAKVEKYKKYSSVIGWYVNDEFNSRGDLDSFFPVLLKRYELLKKLDPDRPAWLVLSTADKALSSQFAATADIQGNDPYPFTNPMHPLTEVLDWSRAASAATGNMKPLFTTVQMFNYGWFLKNGMPDDVIKGCSMPDEKQFKAMVWMAVAGGSSGIAVYNWNGLHRNGLDKRVSCPPFKEVWKQVSSVVTELAGYTDVLLGVGKTFPAKIKHDKTVGSRIFGHGNSMYILAVNGDTQKIKNVEINCMTPVKVLSAGLGAAKYQVNGQNIKIALKPLECIMLQVREK